MHYADTFPALTQIIAFALPLLHVIYPGADKLLPDTALVYRYVHSECRH